ncbi:MAG: glutaredoxin domain-containing protein [Verrucomicrobiota bacterium]
MSALLKLYVKTWCPWCISAKQYLDTHRYEYEEIDVTRDRGAFDEMIRISGQTYAPTLVVDGKILADFGPDELDHFLKSESILPHPEN